MGVYTKVPESEASGKYRMSVRWLYVNKGDTEKPEYRARLVARELKVKTAWLGETDTFASTPPWEAVKMVLSRAVCRRAGGSPLQQKRKVLILDVSRAHFHPLVKREIFINLPHGDETQGMVGKLTR
eukprot:3366718-Amphidinium_carterae.1